MKTRILALLTFLLLLLAFIVPQAAHATPNYTNELDWNDGTNYGARTVFTLDFPSVASGEYYHKYVEVNDVSSNDSKGSVQIGVEVVPGGEKDPFGCVDGNQSSTQLMIYSYDFSTTGGELGPFCYPDVDLGWTSGNSILNSNARFSISAGDTPCAVTTEFYDSSPYAYHLFYMSDPSCNMDGEFSDILYHQSCSCNLNTNEHEIWGGTWTQNQYRNSSGNFINHTTPSQCQNIQAGCPTGSFGYGSGGTGGLGMYWENGKYPGDSGSHGGTLDSCLYQAYSSSYPYCTTRRVVSSSSPLDSTKGG